MGADPQETWASPWYDQQDKSRNSHALICDLFPLFVVLQLCMQIISCTNDQLFLLQEYHSICPSLVRKYHKD